MILLFAMLWHSVALARAWALLGTVADFSHFELHWHDEGHHHHDGGANHVDDSTESVQHVASDHVTASTLAVRNVVGIALVQTQKVALL